MRNILLAIALVVLFPVIATAKEPTNLAVCKQALIRYHDSGAYGNDINEVAKEAAKYLQYRLKHLGRDKKPAIVLDIDETSLSNYPNMVAMNFGGTPQEMRQAEDAGEDVAIGPILDVYRLAKNNHVAVFFITGRYEYERKATEANLKKEGFGQWDGLIMRSKENEKKPAAEYKTAARKLLTEQGYQILLNIGDQKSDLTGGFADRTYKLPNPYYFIP